MTAQYKPFKARLVMGSLFEINTKDHERKPEPNENKHNWFVGWAIPKGAEWDAIYQTMFAEACNTPMCGQALASQPGFNWKFEDCDAPENPQNIGKESYPAGHMLLKMNRFRAAGPIQVVDGSYQPIVNQKAVKRGDYFWVAGSTKFNGAATVKTNAGMYQNIDMVMFAEAGQEIVGEQQSAQSMFAGLQGGAVVNGATSQAGAPAAGSMAAPAPSQPVAPAPSAPVVTPPPAHDLVTPPAPVPAPVEEKYMYQGAAYTREQLKGWSDEQIAANCTRV